MKRIYIYGTGNGAVRLIDVLDTTKYQVLGFLDSNIDKEGEYFYETMITHPSHINKVFDFIFIASQYNEIYNFLLELGTDKKKIIPIYNTDNILDEIEYDWKKDDDIKQILDDLGVVYEIRGKYDTNFDINNDNESHALAIRLIGENKRVLEVGCFSGCVSKVLKENGCEVTGIDIDEEAIKRAEQYCKETFCMDIQNLDELEQLNNEKFDVIYLGDVLEHLVHPKAVLIKLEELLVETGYIVASIPNIAHGSIRLKLLDGEFNYNETGLLDNTHLRFFTKKTIEKMFYEAGFMITKYTNTIAGYDQTEFKICLADYSDEIIEHIKKDKESIVYQYVFMAHKRLK